MMLYLNILTITLLALVAGLLLVVGQQVRVWRRAMAQSPLLAEQLAAQLLSARQGLEDLRKGVLSQGPELARLLSDGGKLRTELQFLLEKADQSAGRLDLQLDKARPYGPALGAPNTTPNGAKLETKPTAPTKGKIVEAVAGANGKAIQPSQPSADPLEELLAGLQAQPAPATPMSRRGPVTQAELDLAQRISKAA